MENVHYWVAPSLPNIGVSLDEKMEGVIKRICDYYSINKGQIIQVTRLRKIVLPRQIAMYIVHKKYGVSSTVTGKKFFKNHATVLYACKAVENIMSYDKNFKKLVKSFY